MPEGTGCLSTFRRFAWSVLAVVVGSGAAFAAGSHSDVAARVKTNAMPVAAASSLAIHSISAPKSVTGGSSASGSVLLNGPAPAGGAVVNLWTSGTPAFVPSSVTVPAGSTSSSFKITTVETFEGAQPVITAFYNGTRKTAALMVKPTPALSSVSAKPGSVVAGGSATGTVILNAAAPTGGMVIALWTSGSPAFVSKKSVTVPAGETTASFPITTSSTSTTAHSTITAFYKGTTKTTMLTVTPSLGLASITAPDSVVGGSPLAGTVSLSAPAPAGGVVVNLWTSGSPAFVPASVKIPAGSTSTGFKITTVQTSAPAHPEITAFYRGASKKITLAVTPGTTLNAVAVSPNKVKAGAPAMGTVTLSAAAPAGGLIIDLWTNGSPAFVPAHVTVPAGANTAKFAVTTTNTPAAAQNTITAFYKGVKKTAGVKVVP